MSKSSHGKVVGTSIGQRERALVATQKSWCRQQTRYPLRSDEVVEIINYVASGGPVMPLDAFTYEGAPWTRAMRR